MLTSDPCRQDAVTAAEEALEATESSSSTPADESQPGIYTEHVFTDPLGVQSNRDTPSNYTQRSLAPVNKKL